MAVEPKLALHLGVKADPIAYRYSYDWLFRLMAEEDVRYLQIGTFFEIYQLPDVWFVDLRERAQAYGIVIDSVFTAHRELGGFFRLEPGWEQVARKNFERLIEVGALLGARSVGHNPGAVLRDKMEDKAEGLWRYGENMKELMHHAHQHGLECLCIEPMSCLAEPPTLPIEIITLGYELNAYHTKFADTVPARYCADISHGYANEQGEVVHGHEELFDVCLPWLHEVHLKNTDNRYCSTFGFSEADRARGIINVEHFANVLRSKPDQIPVDKVIGYLEIGGPKLGRDYSDPLLKRDLQESLRFLKSIWN